MPPEVAEAVIERSGGMCEARTPRCRGSALLPAPAEVLHHRQLRKQGGPHTEDNLLHVCNPCHLFIHGEYDQSIEAGWRISGFAEVTPYQGAPA